MDYEPLPAVKKYTLDSKVKEIMDGINPAEEHHQAGSIKDLDAKLDAVKLRLSCIYTLKRISRQEE
jgi:hypothetical protein